MSQVWVPGVPGVPGTPTEVVERDANGWSSGSVSIHITAGGGGYEFYVPATVVGVVCGLADSYAGVGYRSINHALMFSRGEVSLVENGNIVQPLGAYSGSDKFVIWRAGGDVFVSRNDLTIVRRVSTLGAQFRLASSLYLKGDSIVNAWPVQVNAAVGDATLGPISAFGIQGAANFGVAEIGPVSGNGVAYNRGVGIATLAGAQAIGGADTYAAGQAEIGPLSVYGESGTLQPAWAVGTAHIAGFTTSGHSLVGEVGIGDAELQGLRVLATDHPYGAGDAELEPVFAFGAQAILILAARGTAMHGGRYALSAYGTVSRGGQNILVMPRPELSGYFGSQMTLKSPVPVLAASAMVESVMRGGLMAPSPSTFGRGTVGTVGNGTLVLASRPAVFGYGGGHGRLVAPWATAVGHGVLGVVGRGAVTLQGRYVAAAAGGVRSPVVWALTAPALQLAPRGHAWLVAPTLTIAAFGSVGVTATYEAYAINITTGAVTQYTGFDFDNVLRFGDRFFGVRRDGVYELSGDTDNGEPIIAQVKTFNTDFGKTNLKRVPFVYVVGEAGTDLQVGFAADKKPAINYPVGLVSEQGVQVGRAKAGLGMKGIYYNFTLTNTEGQDFSIDRLEAIVDATTVVKG